MMSTQPVPRCAQVTGCRRSALGFESGRAGVGAGAARAAERKERRDVELGMSGSRFELELIGVLSVMAIMRWSAVEPTSDDWVGKKPDGG